MVLAPSIVLFLLLLLLLKEQLFLLRRLVTGQTVVAVPLRSGQVGVARGVVIVIYNIIIVVDVAVVGAHGRLVGGDGVLGGEQVAVLIFLGIALNGVVGALGLHGEEKGKNI